MLEQPWSDRDFPPSACVPNLDLLAGTHLQLGQPSDVYEYPIINLGTIVLSEMQDFHGPAEVTVGKILEGLPSQRQAFLQPELRDPRVVHQRLLELVVRNSGSLQTQTFQPAKGIGSWGFQIRISE